MKEHQQVAEGDSGTKPSQDAVAREAYAIYLKQDQPKGHDVENWLEAETKLGAKHKMPHAGPEHHAQGVLSWIGILLSTGKWIAVDSPSSSKSETTFLATNIVLWLSPVAPSKVLEAARALVPVLERGGLPAVVLSSGWGPQPDAAPPELIRVVIFKKGPRMTVTGNRITFDSSPTALFFGNGPPR
jgi:hypothetical protein